MHDTKGSDHPDVIGLMIEAERVLPSNRLHKPEPVEYRPPVHPTEARKLDVSKLDGIPDQACSLFALLSLG